MLDLREIPLLPQRQDSLIDQLIDLKAVANRLGLYDAADWLSNNTPINEILNDFIGRQT